MAYTNLIGVIMSESVKKSVRLNADTVEIIRETSQHSEVNWSGSINNIANRYSLLMQDLLPDMTEKEKMVLVAAYNGHAIDNTNIEREVKMFHWQIGEALKYDSNMAELLCDDADEAINNEVKNGDRAKAFYTKVEGWSFSQRLAALHFATSYWAPKFLDG